MPFKKSRQIKANFYKIWHLLNDIGENFKVHAEENDLLKNS